MTVRNISLAEFFGLVRKLSFIGLIGLCSCCHSGQLRLPTLSYLKLKKVADNPENRNAVWLDGKLKVRREDTTRSQSIVLEVDEAVLEITANREGITRKLYLMRYDCWTTPKGTLNQVTDVKITLDGQGRLIGLKIPE